MNAMEIQDLVIKLDGYPIVNGLTLTVEEGERVGIVGDYSDALFVMNILSGLVLPDSGEIWIYNLPPRQALQRGLINYTHRSTLTDTPPVPVLLVAQAIPFQTHADVVIHPLSPIEISDELIQNNYKFINLATLERRNELP